MVIDIGEVEAQVLRPAVEGGGVQHGETVIDVLHLGAWRPLVVMDEPLNERCVATIPAAGIAQHRHQGRPPGGAEGIGHRGKGDGQEAVAIKHEKTLAELGQRSPQGAAGAERRGAVEGITDLEAKPPAVADESRDLVAEMAQAQHRLGHPFAGQLAELVGDKGFTRHFDQRFRPASGDRAEPGGQATGQYGYRRQPGGVLLGHPHPPGRRYCTSTLVPSKSNRKRTSRSPAPSMAARNLLRSSV